MNLATQMWAAAENE
ncbi:unnamed protein product [Cuscuta europaea]|uniref:Uncharacterized protein n=3 Tax=Cuscuta subgen. Cuscuta TaxID=1824621 RepID=A0A9P1A0V7_CUSEU|nr:unnamed protein product [Cuscuta europaea]